MYLLPHVVSLESLFKPIRLGWECMYVHKMATRRHKYFDLEILHETHETRKKETKPDMRRIELPRNSDTVIAAMQCRRVYL